MATPSVSSTVNFVKKYPITLCGFSLLFMPSVHRLLLYFTPLLISTAIFIVAMMSWGPGMSSDRGKKRGKRNDWAFNGSLKIYDDDEEEEDDAEEGEEDQINIDQQGNASEAGAVMQQHVDISIKRDVNRADPDTKLEPKLQEPDPDFDEERNCVRTASYGASSEGQAEPGPDVGGGPAGTASKGQAEPDPDLHGDRVGAASSAEPELNGDCVGTASYDEPDPDLHGKKYVEPVPDQDFSAATAPDHHHRLPAAHDDHPNPAPINPDHHAAGDHLDYHDAEPDHLINYYDAELYHLDYGDEEANQLDYHDAEPDPDLHREPAGNEKSEEAHVGKDDLNAAIISELRQKLSVSMKRTTSYSDDPRDMLSQQLAERLQTLQAAA